MNFIKVISTGGGCQEWVCSCGATALRNNLKRFLKRHPELCSKKAKEKEENLKCNKQLSQGVRSVDYDDSNNLSEQQKENIKNLIHNWPNKGK